MITQNSINNKGFAIGGGPVLTGVKCPAAFLGNMGSGDNDLYTVPSGKRALICSMNCYNGNGSTATCQAQIKVSGTYYKIATAVSVNTATASVLMGLNGVRSGIILEAGESISVNTSVATVNCWARVMEFNNTDPIKTGKQLNMSSGNTTLYTCPAGKTAILLDQAGGFSYQGAFQVYNGNGSSDSVYWMNVPSGQSAGTAYEIVGPSSVATGVWLSVGNVVSLEAGDFIAVNNSVANCNAWVNVIEL